MIYGYARVSADGQSVDAQVKQLRAARAKRIFKETTSDAKSDRAELARALRELGDGDVLMVTRLDRLAHSTRDLLNEPAGVSAWRPLRRQQESHLDLGDKRMWLAGMQA
jgi:hypothetical protein